MAIVLKPYCKLLLFSVSQLEHLPVIQTTVCTEEMQCDILLFTNKSVTVPHSRILHRKAFTLAVTARLPTHVTETKVKPRTIRIRR